MKVESVARPGGAYWSRVSRSMSMRVEAFVIVQGIQRACEMLRTSPATLDELRDEGRLREHVIARIDARLTELGA